MRRDFLLEAIASSQRAYRALADALAAKFTDLEDKTLRRKRAREAARSVLPNATETKIFGRLSAWQNWIFYRPNASGPDGALRAYGTGKRADFDRKRV